MATSRRQSGFLIQSTFGTRGNFEVVTSVASAGAPDAGGLSSTVDGLQHRYRDNDNGSLPWAQSASFGNTEARGAALLQGTFGGNLEVITRVRDGLIHYWRDGAGWHEGTTFGTNARGNPALIQSDYGRLGNAFEVITAGRSGGLMHFWRDNNAAAPEWSSGDHFGSNDERFDAVCMIESSLQLPGEPPRKQNLEVYALQGGDAVHWVRDGGTFLWDRGETVGPDLAGQPSLIQSTFATPGNFELVAPHFGGGLVHFSRDMRTAGFPWSAPTRFGTGAFRECSLIQSNYNHLEVVAHGAAGFVHFWRDRRNRWHEGGRFS